MRKTITGRELKEIYNNKIKDNDIIEIKLEYSPGKFWSVPLTKIDDDTEYKLVDVYCHFKNRLFHKEYYIVA